jgi:hypothetical protein
MLRLRGLLWIAFLGPLFFLTYNFANASAAARAHVPSLAFEWESHIPFLAWTIFPYWSSDLLYGLSLLLAKSKSELDTHARRLLAVQLLSVACFIAFPLRVAFAAPLVDGAAGWLFAQLRSFDQPFNQAPSLHVSLAVILWDFYRRRLPACTVGWFLLIALSAWTTYQHQFIDLPMGAWLGVLIVTTMPAKGLRHPWLAAAYLAGAVLLTTLAFLLQGWAWCLLIGAFPVSLVSAAYWSGNPHVLGKTNGRLPFWMWPVEFGARCNAYLWTRNTPPHTEIRDGVWLGRARRIGEQHAFASVVDLTAELSTHADIVIPVLDLTPPTNADLTRAAECIDAAPKPVLVCCALGVSRSAAAVAAWLIATGRASSVEAACAEIHQKRPLTRLNTKARKCLQQWSGGRNEFGP